MQSSWSMNRTLTQTKIVLFFHCRIVHECDIWNTSKLISNYRSSSSDWIENTLVDANKQTNGREKQQETLSSPCSCHSLLCISITIHKYFISIACFSFHLIPIHCLPSLQSHYSSNLFFIELLTRIACYSVYISFLFLFLCYCVWCFRFDWAIMSNIEVERDWVCENVCVPFLLLFSLEMCKHLFEEKKWNKYRV